MNPMGFTLKAAKGNFFDAAAVMKAMDRGRRKALSKFGAFVRQRARTSIRKRRAVSEPGQPPSSHTDVLRKGILFAYDPGPGSVVIGPVLLGAGSDAPRLAEEGGEATRRVRGRTRTLHYRARPFMGPAFDKELPQAPSLWAGAAR